MEKKVLFLSVFPCACAREDVNKSHGHSHTIALSRAHLPEALFRFTIEHATLAEPVFGVVRHALPKTKTPASSHLPVQG